VYCGENGSFDMEFLTQKLIEICDFTEKIGTLPKQVFISLLQDYFYQI
jgi:hypothetical protein